MQTNLWNGSVLAKIKCNRATRIYFNQGSTNSFYPTHQDQPKSLLILGKGIPCVELFRDIAPTTDANFDVCCNKTGDCQINQDLSLHADEKMSNYWSHDLKCSYVRSRKSHPRDIISIRPWIIVLICSNQKVKVACLIFALTQVDQTWIGINFGNL